MNAGWIAWSLAVGAVAAGYAGWGWRGVALAFTVMVFWLLLDFSRSLRALRSAAGRPVGRVANAVMLQARLSRGLHLTRVLGLTQSLGTKVSDDPETFRWTDDHGDDVTVVLHHGRVASWQLKRAGA